MRLRHSSIRLEGDVRAVLLKFSSAVRFRGNNSTTVGASSKWSRAQLTSAQKALSDTELRAPFAGRIGRTYVDNFNNVQAKQPILLLQDLTQLEAVVNFPEQDWLRAKAGLTLTQRNERAKLEVSLSTLPDRSFPAAITEIAAAADPVTRTFCGPRASSIPLAMSSYCPACRPPSPLASRTTWKGSGARYRFPPTRSSVAMTAAVTCGKSTTATMTVSLAAVTPGQLSGSEIDYPGGSRDGRSYCGVGCPAPRGWNENQRAH